MGITSIRLSNDVEVPLEQLVQKLDRSKNYIINLAIKEFVARQLMEDARWAETLKALESVKSGKIVDEDDVTQWLKSWGSKGEKAPPGS
ncbi:MAG: transcriptional regulator [Cellvibrionales bacterium]|nr:MAG: transcriptional regulator [Cellvibrionales bacterium]